MPYIRVRGVEHYYHWIGSSEPLDGKPIVVFLHGWGGSARSLSDRFNCLLYDLRGFGRSSSMGERESIASSEVNLNENLNYELESYTEDLATLLDVLAIEKVSINAHSMGASIAALFLNRYRDRVERAILNCSGIFDYDERAFAAFYKFGGSVVKFRPAWLAGVPWIDRLFMARFLHRRLDRQVSRAFLRDFLQADAAAALGTIYACVSQKSAQTLPLEFAQLSVPTLLISGQYDRIIPAVLGERAANLSDRIEYAVIPNTGHFPMLEDESIYLPLIRDFLVRATLQ
jgi:pimeloyl-ACP methyl ester carboxylesterase